MIRATLAPTFTALAAISISLFASVPAYADCTGAAEIVSYGTLPPDGATDVPTNAHFVIFAHDAIHELRIGGEVVERTDSLSRWELSLDPNAAIDLVLVGGLEEDEETFSFQTSDAVHTSTVAAPVVQGAMVSEDAPATSECADLTAWTGCPDSFDPLWLALDIAPDEAVHGYLIQRVQNDGEVGDEFDQLWPTSCGTPLFNGYITPGDCFQVRAIDEWGHFSSATEVCLSESPTEPVDMGAQADAGPDAGPDSGTAIGSSDVGTPDGGLEGLQDDDLRGSGCSTTSGGTVPVLPLLLFGLFRMMARRR